MIRRIAILLALPLACASACCGEPEIREDSPERLVQDLARALRADAVEWLDEEAAVQDGPAGMGAVASQDVTAGVIRFQRLLERGRALCDRWLPPGTSRLQVPGDWHPELRALIVALALAEPEEILATAADPPASPSAPRRVTLRAGAEAWTLDLRPVKDSWEFASGLRRRR